MSVANHVPIADAAIRNHFDVNFRGAVSPVMLNADLDSLRATAPWRIVALDAGTAPDVLLADVVSGDRRFGLEIETDARGLIGGLYLQPTPALPRSPGSWTRVTAQLAHTAPAIGFLAARVSKSGSCNVVASTKATTPRPIGSMFKLFVLGALAREASSGVQAWSHEIALTGSDVTFPSGVLQVDPLGTRYPLGLLAQQMIASSDNTAADMVMSLVGRRAVEAQVRAWSAHASLDEPFLTPREFFVLKYADYPHLADRFLSIARSQRDAYLETTIDATPGRDVALSSAALSHPRDVNEVEWFASPLDLCHAFAGLYEESLRPGSSSISAAMSLNDGGLGLSSSRWPTVWFKGGSEPGVLSLGYLAKNSSGEIDVVIVELSNPVRPLGTNSSATALSAIRGAFALLGRASSAR